MIIKIQNRTLKILLVIIVIFDTLWVQWPRLADPFRVDEDFRTFYWMNKFQEEGLFPNDQLRGNTYTIFNLPWGELPLDFASLGYHLIFYAASFLVPPTLFSKLIPFVLIAITVFVLFDYGKSLAGRNVGVAVALGFAFFNLASATSLSVVSGLQRGFACSLIILLLFYLQHNKPVAAAAIVFVSALIYPPMFLLGLATAGLYFLTLRPSSTLDKKVRIKSLVALVGAFCLGALVLSPVMLPKLQGAFSPASESVTNDLYTSNELNVLKDARFRPGGRSQIFDIFPVIGRAGLVTKTTTALHLVILIVIGGLIFLVRKPRQSLLLPRELWCLLLSSLGLFLAAWISAFLTGSFFLYLPSRYTRVGLTLFLSLFTFLNLPDAIKDGATFIHQNPKTMGWFIGGVEVLAVAFVIFYPGSQAVVMGVNLKWLLVGIALLLGVFFILRLVRPSHQKPSTELGKKRDKYIFIGFLTILGLIVWGAYARIVRRQSDLAPSPAERELLTYLETLPKDVLIGGTPCSLDNVTLFSRRQILFSCEHVSADDQMMQEALDAYYAEEVETVVNFCDTYGVDYLVIDSRTYTQEFIDNGWLFFEPQNQVLLPLVQSRDSFVLAQVPDSSKIFESGRLFVVPCIKAALN